MFYSKLLPLVLILFVNATVFAQASQKKPQILTMPQGVVELHIDVDDQQVEIVKTKGSRISIETSVKIEQGSLPLLNYLMEAGRYDLTAHENMHLNILTIRPTKNDRVLLVKGKECEEIVRYKIHVPESVEFVKTLNASNDTTASL